MMNQVKTVVLLGVLSALVVGIGGALAPGSLAVWLVLALAMNVGAYFFSDRLVLRMNGARPPLACAGSNHSARSSSVIAGATGRKSSRSFNSFRRACMAGSQGEARMDRAPNARGPNSMRPWNQPTMPPRTSTSATAALKSAGRS